MVISAILSNTSQFWWQLYFCFSNGIIVLVKSVTTLCCILTFSFSNFFFLKFCNHFKQTLTWSQMIITLLHSVITYFILTQWFYSIWETPTRQNVTITLLHSWLSKSRFGSYDPTILRSHLLKTIQIFQGSCDHSRSVGSYDSDNPKWSWFLVIFFNLTKCSVGRKWKITSQQTMFCHSNVERYSVIFWGFWLL